MSWNMSAYYQIQQMKIPLLIIVGIAILLLFFSFLIKWSNKDDRRKNFN